MSCLLIAAPVGPLLVHYGEAGLHALRFWPQGEHPPAGTRDAPAMRDALGRRLVLELAEYFERKRTAFDLPLAPPMGTAFQREVWNALLRIPCGETRSYQQVAEMVGRPGAARAIGQANACNPLPIVVPCHRVLAADGSLGGYMGEWGGTGNGLALKRWPRAHEGAEVPLAKRPRRPAEA
jgi:methylated-DNA-[protein]-cysteine S-methyltransferase